jgi:DNA-binding LacI/PurR family transcriptional regulator
MKATSSGTVTARVAEALTEKITAGRFREGDALPPISELAEQFDTSVHTIHQALKRLDEEGYVRRQHGVGCFVADTTAKVDFTESVGICLDPDAHLFGPLAKKISEGLSRCGRLSFPIDPSRDHGKDVLLRAARSGVKTFVVQGNCKFPYEVLDSAHLHDTQIVGVVKWMGPLVDNVSGVVSDSISGGHSIANFLFEAGHSRAIMCVTSDFIRPKKLYDQGDENIRRFPPPCLAFIDRWEQYGGEVETCLVDKYDEPPYQTMHDESALMDLFDSDAPPTTVVGMYDALVFAAQQCLREHRPELLDAVEFVGYYDTPWSQAAHPPFSSVSLNVEQMAEETVEILTGEAFDGDDSSRKRLKIVTPELIIRG